jgi:hypothetical protein
VDDEDEAFRGEECEKLFSIGFLSRVCPKDFLSREGNITMLDAAPALPKFSAGELFAVMAVSVAVLLRRFFFLAHFPSPIAQRRSKLSSLADSVRCDCRRNRETDSLSIYFEHFFMQNFFLGISFLGFKK